jgi:hypothetical protein
MSKPSFSIKEDLPAPGGPVMPNRKQVCDDDDDAMLF